MRGAFVFLLFSFLLAGALFAGAFSERMMQAYFVGGQMPQEKIALLNEKAAEKLPSTLSPFISSNERINALVKTNEGEEVKIKAAAHKNTAGALQLDSVSLGAYSNPTIVISTSEETAERIYDSKDEAKEMRLAIGNGEIKVEFPGDFLRGFFWSVANAFTGIMNAFV